MADTDLATVPLDALHRRLGARMVGFAGYAMPVQYQGIIAEHHQCRQHAALFDVSHMGQASLPAASSSALERVVTGDIAGLKPGRQRYTLLTNAEGGIVDDLMVARLGERLMLVLNAANKQADAGHIRAHLPEASGLTTEFDRALLALQGPDAAAVLAPLAPASESMRFMDAIETTMLDAPVTITRSGYTGEDGFEIGMAAADAQRIAEALLADDRVKPAGLGARDSLRLEAGLPLHGNEIDATTDPVSAGLGFAIGKRRRMGWDFLGGDVIRRIHDEGPEWRLVGLTAEGRAPVRAGAVILDESGKETGHVTSGTFSPTLGRPIALARLRADCAADGTRVFTDLRGTRVALTVTPLPFVPHRYVR